MIKDPDLIDRRAITDMLEEIADKGEAMRKSGEDDLSYRRRTAIANAARTLIESVKALPVAYPSAIDSTRAEERERVFEKLIQTAKLLLQNAEGCAVNHHGEDFAIHGAPGWIADCRAGIEAAVRVRVTPAPAETFKVKPSDEKLLAAALQASSAHVEDIPAPAETDKAWHRLSEAMPDAGRKFVALHSDGSGATMFYRYDDGFIDAEGYDTAEARVDLAFHLSGYDRWAYLPDDLAFWCEKPAEDPYQFPAARSALTVKEA